MILRAKLGVAIVVMAASAQAATGDYQCGEQFQRVLNEIGVDASMIKLQKVAGGPTDTMLLAGKEFARSSTAMVSQNRITDISVDVDERTDLIALEPDCSVKRIANLDPMGPIEVSPALCNLTNDPRQLQLCESYTYLMKAMNTR